MKYRWIACIVFFVFLVPLSCSAADTFDHKIEIKDISFHWTVDGDQLNISLAAKTEGWLAVGFNPSKAMKDANLILGYVKKGKVKVVDHYGVTRHQHKSDKKLGGKNNITNISGTEEKGITTINFTIPLNSGDENDQVISVSGETTVLLAYGSGRDSFRTRHKLRAVLKVNLKTGKYNIVD